MPSVRSLSHEPKRVKQQFFPLKRKGFSRVRSESSCAADAITLKPLQFQMNCSVEDFVSLRNRIFGAEKLFGSEHCRRRRFRFQDFVSPRLKVGAPMTWRT
jgi:hypothetical protein